MLYRYLADAVVVLHLAFIVFVIFGGLLVFQWRWMWVAHIPATTWGALIEFQGWLCPLTPFEQTLRAAGGEPGYKETFIEHYVVPIIYPEGLARNTQIIFGVIVVVVNLVIYALILLKRRNSNINR